LRAILFNQDGVAIPKIMRLLLLPQMLDRNDKKKLIVRVDFVNPWQSINKLRDWRLLRRYTPRNDKEKNTRNDILAV
jgi:hypothetical protein